MKQTAKWLLAREIIILFSCAMTVVLIWIFLWSINVININKSKNIQKQIYSINHQIDSITDQISIDSFEEIFEGKIPKKLLEESENDPLHLNLNDLAIFSEDFNAKKGNLIPVKDIPHPREIIFNLHLLRSILLEAGFQSDSNKIVEEPNKTFFDKSILMEINNEIISNENLSKTKPSLYKIYTFLLSKNYLKVTFYEFFMELTEKPHLPPLSEDLIENLRLRDDVKKNLTSTKSSVYNAEELKKNVKIIGIWILIVVYPLRFLILLLIWSIKTLRQKQG